MVLTRRIQTTVFVISLAILLSGKAFGGDIFWCIDKEGIKKLRNYPCGSDEYQLNHMGFIHIKTPEPLPQPRSATPSAQDVRQQYQDTRYDKAMNYIKGGSNAWEQAARARIVGNVLQTAEQAAATGNPDNATARFNAALGATTPPPPPTPRSAINAYTGEVYPGVAGGIINPRNGQFSQEVAGGYFNITTGQFMPAH